MNKVKLLGIIAFAVMVLTLPVQLSAQTAARLEALLESPAISWEEAAAFIREAAQAPQQRMPQNATPGEIARLNDVALLLMRAFDIKGGIFYNIFQGPHHAYRELVYLNVIRGNTDPHMPVSGQQLLLMINRILTLRGE